MNSGKFASCIAACSACAVESSQCASACLKNEDIKLLARCIKLNHDCAAICFLAMGAMAGGSEFTTEICSLTVKISIACAEECEKHSQIEHCRKCAEVCRQCAAECSNIIKQQSISIYSHN